MTPDPEALRALVREVLREVLADRAGTPPGSQSSVRIERGAVLERHVREAAASGARLVAGPAAVVTPLARERARTEGVEIVVERRQR